MLPRPFRIQSRLPPEQVRGLVKGAFVDWFEIREAPRGWIIGPLMCVWRTAFTNDNTVYALILRAGWRTRVVGFSLSDVARPFFALCLLAILWGIWNQYAAGEMLLRGAILFSVIIGALFTLLARWPMAKREPPSVRFLRRLIEQDRAVSEEVEEVPLPTFECNPRALDLILSGMPTGRVESAADVISAFRKVEDASEEFIILAASDEQFIQSAPMGDGFIVEWRDGSEDRHFTARLAADREEELCAREALALLLTFAHDAAWPDSVIWRAGFGSA
ncbi:hypothetical protein [Aurantiacibacter poecillastricola]|uniref:hypothetical protein n=1 Tax=Aurantiacibacter poecillastricola TaxID=3064385 RepID=UPI00273D987D|nr:hypothetical protein [Aurantiacibacter sp. 219JJ12-13]MDP5260791.1 hypothetical protein [Aurantiacibacter sp. 219JJ12-13]